MRTCPIHRLILHLDIFHKIQIKHPTIKRSTRITTFDAASANIPDAALAPFSRALRSSPFLRVLRLEGCSLSGRPVALLTAGLRQNSSVHELYLAENRLAPEDGAHLRALISLSSTLQLLDLRNNDLQDIGNYLIFINLFSIFIDILLTFKIY